MTTTQAHQELNKRYEALKTIFEAKPKDSIGETLAVISRSVGIHGFIAEIMPDMAIPARAEKETRRLCILVDIYIESLLA